MTYMYLQVEHYALVPQLYECQRLKGISSDCSTNRIIAVNWYQATLESQWEWIINTHCAYLLCHISGVGILKVRQPSTHILEIINFVDVCREGVM